MQLALQSARVFAAFLSHILADVPLFYRIKERALNHIVGPRYSFILVACILGPGAVILPLGLIPFFFYALFAALGVFTVVYACFHDEKHEILEEMHLDGVRDDLLAKCLEDSRMVFATGTPQRRHPSSSNQCPICSLLVKSVVRCALCREIAGCTSCIESVLQLAFEEDHPYEKYCREDDQGSHGWRDEFDGTHVVRRRVYTRIGNGNDGHLFYKAIALAIRWFVTTRAAVFSFNEKRIGARCIHCNGQWKRDEMTRHSDILGVLWIC